MVGRRFAQLLMLLDGAVEMMSVSALCAHSFGLFHSASGEQRCISRFSLFEAKLLPLAPAGAFRGQISKYCTQWYAIVLYPFTF